MAVEWWVPCTAVIGAATGIYGSVRAWRTAHEDRRRRVEWNLEHFQNDAWVLTSRLSYRALDVELVPPTGGGFDRAPRSPLTLGSNEGDTFQPTRRYTFAPGEAGSVWTVRWRRFPWGRLRERALLLPPPKP
jgi:hypothetical protein